MLAASEQVNAYLLGDYLFLGDLSLDKLTEFKRNVLEYLR
ncbi:MAG: hypothetical protein QNJ55_02045 [Xenococcus sp. MO_188.B8]|nr:hypothetical protein [Xenococcus sp. MO_188.B8]